MEENLYPIYYKGRNWKESEVNVVFRSYYNTVHALDHNKTVYVAGSMRIAPDGEWSDL